MEPISKVDHSSSLALFLAPLWPFWPLTIWLIWLDHRWMLTLYDNWSCCMVSVVMQVMSKCREEDDKEWVNMTKHHPDMWRKLRVLSFEHYPTPTEHYEIPLAGVFSCLVLLCTLQVWQDTPLVGIFTCLACPTPAEHDETPILGIFYAWCHPALFKYDETPLVGIFSCSAPPCTL